MITYIYYYRLKRTFL